MEAYGIPAEDVPVDHFLAMDMTADHSGAWVLRTAGLTDVTGYIVEYEDPGLVGCVAIDRRFPIYDTAGGGWMLVRRVQVCLYQDIFCSFLCKPVVLTPLLLIVGWVDLASCHGPAGWYRARVWILHARPNDRRDLWSSV